MKALRHTGIVVNDLARAVHFYKDILGFKVKRDMLEFGPAIDSLFGFNGVKVKTIKLSADDGNLIELLYYESHRATLAKRNIYDTGYSHIALTVDRLDEEYSKLKKMGIKFSGMPQISADGKVKIAFCHDPEGNSIELVEEIG